MCSVTKILLPPLLFADGMHKSALFWAKGRLLCSLHSALRYIPGQFWLRKLAVLRGVRSADPSAQINRQRAATFCLSGLSAAHNIFCLHKMNARG